jgi:flavodoxin
MRIGIVYFSKTGVTKGLARIAAEDLGAASHDVELIPLQKLDPAASLAYDLLLIGSYCDSSTYPKAVRELFARLKPGARVASFVTHSTLESGPLYEKWAAGCEKFFAAHCARNGLMNKGYFHCRGKPSLAIAVFIRFWVFKKNRAGWKEYRKDLFKYPREAEILRFKEFIKTFSA